jgi:hypothetical protein
MAEPTPKPEPLSWLFKAIWGIGLLIMMLIALPHVAAWIRSTSASYAQKDKAVQNHLGQSDYTITNTVAINSYTFTKIDRTGDKHFEWGVVEWDFPLDIILNGKPYYQPRRDDPQWKALKSIPVETLELRVADENIQNDRHISCEHTRSN